MKLTESIDKLCKLYSEEKSQFPFIRDLFLERIPNTFQYIQTSDNKQLQFKTILIMNKNIEDKRAKIMRNPDISTLDESQINEIKLGDSKICFFVTELINRLKSKGISCAEVLNPYSYYEDMSINANFSTITKEEKLDTEAVVNSFVNIKEIDMLMNLLKDKQIKKFSDNEIRNSILEFQNNFWKGSKESREKYVKFLTTAANQNDLKNKIILFQIILFSIRQIISEINQFIYKAISNRDLVVIKENSILDIKNITCHGLYNEKTFLLNPSQENKVPLRVIPSDVFLEIYKDHDENIKKYMILRSATLKLNDLGLNSSCTFWECNDNLNPINIEVLDLNNIFTTNS